MTHLKDLAERLRKRLERIHVACMDHRPKQAVGEMIAAMLHMTEWGELAATLERLEQADAAMPVDAVLQRVKYHAWPECDGEPADYEIFPADVDCPDCIQALIVRDGALAALTEGK